MRLRIGVLLLAFVTTATAVGSAQKSDLSAIAQVVLREGHDDEIPKLMDRLGMPVGSHYRVIWVIDAPRDKHEVDAYVVAGKTMLVFGRLTGDTGWFIRTTLDDYEVGVRFSMVTGDWSDSAMPRTDGEKLLATETAFWLKWLANRPTPTPSQSP